MALAKNVAHILAQIERVGEDALHWGAATKNLLQSAPLLTLAIRFSPLSFILVFARSFLDYRHVILVNFNFDIILICIPQVATAWVVIFWKDAVLLGPIGTCIWHLVIRQQLKLYKRGLQFSR